MGAHASKKRLTEIFEALDEDHNGSISTDEVMAWVQGTHMQHHYYCHS
jgi:Ca2+-binding EF-hand superfamily protein